MDYTIIYYHRLHFPTISGQTLQVLRDYHAIASLAGTVHIFYRGHEAFPDDRVKSILQEHYGINPGNSFHLHCVTEGLFSKFRIKKKVLELAENSSSPVFIVTRTPDHAAGALKIRDRIKGHAVKVLIELHETAIPHMVYREENRHLRAALSVRMEKKIFSRVDGILCTAHPQSTVLDEKFTGHSPAIVLPNGFNNNFFSTSTSCHRDNRGKAFRIRYAGQIPAWKNFQAVIEALSFLQQNVILDIAGGKKETEEEMRDMLMGYGLKYGVQQRVNYVGALLPPQVPEFLMGADCLVLPLGDNVQSRLFTSPMKLFEYAASGVPMVVTDHPTTSTLVKDGVHALMVRHGSAADMADAVRRLMTDNVLGQKISHNAAILATQYTSEKRAGHYRDFLDKLIGEK